MSSSQSQVGSFALVLGEMGGTRRLPIIIGGFEAQAIALEIENIKPNRPMTHDLLLSIARSYDIVLKQVIITDLKEGVFYAEMQFERGGESIQIDARPSDAIAVAVRYQAPIFTTEQIMSEAGIVIKDSDFGDEVLESLQDEEGEGDEGSTEESGEELTEMVEQAEQGKMSDLSKKQLLKKLHKQMDDAINKEDYEKAARLRDEINRLEKS